MTKNDFLSAIQYSEQALAVYRAQSVPKEVYLAAKTEYYHDEDAFLARIKQEKGEEYYSALLFYFTDFAYDLYERYLEMGFSEEEYLATFYDLKIWNEMCMLETGICGLRETHWLTSHLHAGIVRLGRLQFQPDTLEEDVSFQGETLKAGQRVLNVHIPFGGALTQSEVENSFRLAAEHFGEGSYLHLESWLLDPTLKDLLPAHSNILAFANRFTLYKTQKESSIERFVFRVVNPDKSAYVANNAFQQKVKAALTEGREFYSGYGVARL
ncbi:MAG: DUF5596 domain-containing protein [Clostridia bacterium]|nr:DUF5596 domain-containing protein [Clostridia bacterium]